MTEERYLDDATVREFDATVERVAGDRVVLDRTHFYPTGGGQPHDTGTLEADGAVWDVTDVRKKDTVYHSLAVDGDPPTAGTAVTGRLDWDRRYAHMRYHTAQHLLSALLLEEYDAETTGNQLYHDHAHLDCAYPRFSADDLDDIESQLNDLVADALPVRWYELDREEAEATLDPERTRIHLLPNSITRVRIVEIGGRVGADADEVGGRVDADAGEIGERDGLGAGEVAPEEAPYDRTACAGTHVSNTEEIGSVEETGRQTQGSDRERIHFVIE
ncbi:alanyl-tRNA editing protein [Halegenticoccus soli]|uniref:alanyl-tRNA editing protein n=1 Tax=Halegenticoccus soli TaxID=1985678 RepID=UPI000C6ED1E5|nr:alanyl-tRNA editing protein [Halegenticoccus soli]